MTDALQAIAQNTAGCGRQVLNSRYAELAGIVPRPEDVDGDEIVADLIKRAGLRVKE